MAYGKIKLDTITWDNSGTDTDITVSTIPTAAQVAAKAPLASPTFTGTVTAAALTVSGNLQVNGTTTTVASSTMTVTDKNIEIAKGAANDAAADGAGITVDSGDGDKTWNWVNANDAWTSSEHIHVGDNKRVYAGADKDLEYYHSGTHGYLVNNTGALRIFSSPSHEAINIAAGAAVTVSHANAVKLTTTANGVTVTGTVTDSKGDVRNIPRDDKTSAYTLVATDAGKCISTNAGITVNNSVFSDTNAVTIINGSGSDITITQGSGLTIYNSADAATGNRTLAGRGMCTLYFVAANYAYISGAGLS